MRRALIGTPDGVRWANYVLREERAMTDDELRDEVVPSRRWDFDGEVTRVFDDMLARSIPQYEVMRAAVDDLAALALRRAGVAGEPDVVVDLGCSRGEAIARLVERFPCTRFVGCEISAPMLEAARARFASLEHQVAIQNVDLRRDRPRFDGPATVILAVLTVQFVPIEYRQALLQWAHDVLKEHGALLIVEKVLGNGAALDADFVELYYAMKRRRGYTDEQIDRKRLALEGVLVPQTARSTESMLRESGFRHVDTFWAWMNFRGWACYR